MGAGAGFYQASGVAALMVLFALTGLVYVEDLLKLKSRYMLFRVTTDNATDLVAEVHGIFRDLNIRLDNCQVSSLGSKHMVQFDADVTQRQQELALSAMTRPGVSVEMLPIERQHE
jgi:uncharacterized membrane protein YhiD involved in acid resistance